MAENVDTADFKGTRNQIVQFLRDDLGIDISAINDQTLLFSSGIIDSFAVINLVSHIENICGMRLNPLDVNLDNFDSVERITNFVQKMQAST